MAPGSGGAVTPEVFAAKGKKHARYQRKAQRIRAALRALLDALPSRGVYFDHEIMTAEQEESAQARCEVAIEQAEKLLAKGAR